jgi:hypothetical protein
LRKTANSIEGRKDKETVKKPGMQNWNKEHGHKTTAASEIQEEAIWVRQEGFQNTVREASNRDVQRVAEGEKLDFVEGSAPFEADGETMTYLAQEQPEMWEHRPLWTVSPPPLERQRT